MKTMYLFLLHGRMHEQSSSIFAMEDEPMLIRIVKKLVVKNSLPIVDYEVFVGGSIEYSLAGVCPWENWNDVEEEIISMFS